MSQNLVISVIQASSHEIKRQRRSDGSSTWLCRARSPVGLGLLRPGGHPDREYVASCQQSTAKISVKERPVELA